MADIYLDVPFVNQSKFGSDDDPRKDPTGCWYAGVSMVGFYFEAGPRLGLPELFTKKVGTFKDGSDMIGHQVVTPDKYPQLLKNENMVAMDSPKSKAWAVADLVMYLRKYGPLMFRWKKTSARTGNTYGHVSVLIGANEATGKVTIHDPENAPNTQMSIADFNSKHNWASTVGSLFRKDGPEFQMRGTYNG